MSVLYLGDEELHTDPAEPGEETRVPRPPESSQVPQQYQAKKMELGLN